MAAKFKGRAKRGSEETFNECRGVSNVFPTAALVQAVVIFHHEVASIPLGEVNRESCSVSA